MLDYDEIFKHFGKPLNEVPKPRMPYKFKPWHAIVVVATGYILYRGIKSIKEDFVGENPTKEEEKKNEKEKGKEVEIDSKNREKKKRSKFDVN